MKRLLVIVPLAAVALLFCGATAEAKTWKYPPRYTRGSFAETIARPTPQGKVVTRQVYEGYRQGFPPPAFLHYGYPHSGDYGLPFGP